MCRQAVVTRGPHHHCLRKPHSGHRRASDGTDVDAGWIQVYAPKYPYAEAAKAELARLTCEEVFAKQLEMYLGALAMTGSSSPATPVTKVAG